MCPFCEQYNGFTEEGDYNRDIPAQYCSSLNSAVGCQRSKKPQTQPSLALGNGFCQTCNLNQTLKVRALADYTPIDPDNYDKEIEEYRKRLERVYALCRQCEATLHQTLGKQDSWLKPKLISWRLMLSSQNKAQIYATVKNTAIRVPVYLRFFHIIGLLISLGLFLGNLHHLQEDSGRKVVSLDFGLDFEVYLSTLYKFASPLIITGLSLVLLVIFCSGKEALLISDAIASFIWVGLLALSSSKQLISKKDYNSLQVLISAAAVIFTLWTTFVPRQSSSTKMQTKSPQNKSMMSNVSSARLEDSQCTLNASLSDELGNITPPCSPRPRDVTSTPIPNINSQPKESINLDTTMESLKISSPAKTDTKNRPTTPFSPRVLFSEKTGYNSKLNDSYSSQQAPISPRLSTKNITQSSWVAGGYWGNPGSPSRDFSPHKPPTLGMMHQGQTNLYPLSRSSSQSSGFVSHSSGIPSYNPQMPCSLPGSPHGSLCGDVDRVSVLSEPAYKPWGYPGSIYTSETASQYSYARQRGLAKSDAQSLYSCASAFSERSHIRGPPSPTASNLYLFQDAIGNLSENSSNSSSTRNTTKIRKADTTMVESHTRNGPQTKQPILNYRNPWIAFFLGMSIAANCFFALLLFARVDLHTLIGT